MGVVTQPVVGATLAVLAPRRLNPYQAPSSGSHQYLTSSHTTICLSSCTPSDGSTGPGSTWTTPWSGTSSARPCRRAVRRQLDHLVDLKRRRRRSCEMLVNLSTVGRIWRARSRSEPSRRDFKEGTCNNTSRWTGEAQRQLI